MNAAPAPASQVGRAVGLMALSTVLFGLMAVCIRLASKQLHPFEIAFFRNFFGLLALLPILLRHGTGLPRTRNLGRYATRTVVGLGSMLCAFWAIGHLPLAHQELLVDALQSLAVALAVVVMRAPAGRVEQRHARFAPYVAGDSFTLADIVFLYSVDLAAAVGKQVFGLDLLSEIPAGAALLQRLGQNANVQGIAARLR